jgi:hypothetical protein
MQPAEQMEQQGSAGLAEWQVAQLVETTGCRTISQSTMRASASDLR